MLMLETVAEAVTGLLADETIRFVVVGNCWAQVEAETGNKQNSTSIRQNYK